MASMRFSIRTLLIITTFVAVSCVALVYSNAFLATYMTTGAFVCCCFGILAASLRHNRPRAFWIGFAVFGSAYFWFSMNEHEIDPRGYGAIVTLQSSDLVVEPRMATTKLLLWLYPYDAGALADASGNFIYGKARYLVEIGHAIFTVLFAVIGGWIGTWLYARETALRS